MRTSTGILKHLIRCRTVKAACTLGSYFMSSLHFDFFTARAIRVAFLSFR